MKLKKLSLCVASVFVFAGTGTAHAGGIPTIDVTNIVQTTLTSLNSFEEIANQIKQIQNQIDQLRQLEQQLDQAKEQFEAMTGSYNMSDLLNGVAEQQAREWAPDDWRNVLDVYEGGGNEMGETAREAREAGEDFGASDVYDDLTPTTAERYIRRGREIFGAMGIGEHSYNLTSDRIETVEGLINNIDTATDPKAAQDLGNRIQAETALLMTELIRLQSAQMVMVANEQNHQRNLDADRVRRGDPTVSITY